MILFTADKDTSAPFFELELIKEKKFLHLPLENFQYRVDEEESGEIRNHMGEFAFIIHGNLRNAKYFVEWMKQNSTEEQVRGCVNIVLDKPTAKFLESHDIPAIQPREPAKPIDILEFMLRISKEGSTLYPTTENKTEEMPGLLKELQMPVAEFSVCEEVPLDEETLKDYKAEVGKSPVEVILLHNRSSYVRVKTAFPDLDLLSKTVVAGSLGTTELMEKEGLKPDYLAKGSWDSIAKVLNEI
ncbi:hypothetical protein [Rhodohalobacter barkolensis]|uniref:Uroporphyrinogen-III synthase n=1 Tax=Rhodohalobacter barkolensis TaxID=2053187 RepID=A0A2N0VLZ5_9BACT|nr:hypothetical protein [Rhodohalobacter barkolensis]PKD45223.1 hypothetical protein CWD77_07195 [Rhodohalobacter barkolensis]